jgi:hypothetical protein
MEPSPTSLLSMFPPKYCGGIMGNSPLPGAVPITPRKGLVGIVTPPRNPFLADVTNPFDMFHSISFSSNFPLRRPKSLSMALHPHFAVSIFEIFTSSASPSSAPSTYIGPTAMSNFELSRVFRLASLKSSLICLVEESGISTMKVSRSATTSIGSKSPLHFDWRLESSHPLITFKLPLLPQGQPSSPSSFRSKLSRTGGRRP